MMSPPPAEFALKRSLRAGFTLVEIAIVLVIIGLIIGGILVGADLIAVATLRSQVAQLERYNTAVSTFFLKYNAIPGDMPPGLAAQNGFVARSGARGRGDGNGVIEGSHANGNYYGWNQYGEPLFFWMDLSSVNLMSGGSFNSGVDGVTPSDEPEKYFPRAAIAKGAFIKVYSTCESAGGCYIGLPGTNYFTLGFISAGTELTAGYGGLRVKDAFTIDQKMDDGMPQTGAVTAVYPNVNTSWIPNWATNAATSSASTCFETTNKRYSTDFNGGGSGACGLSFRMQSAAR